MGERDMATLRFVLAIGLPAALAGCVPAGGNFQGGGAPGGGIASGPQSGPAVRYPVATAREIREFVSGSSTYIEYYCNGELCAAECGFFGHDGSYEADLYEIYPDGSYYIEDYEVLYGGWSAREGELCINAGGEFGTEPLGCFLTEWNTSDDALLLIDSRDDVIASVMTWSGASYFYDYGCDLY